MMRLCIVLVLALSPLVALAHVGVWGTDTYCDCVMNRPNGGQAFNGINAVGGSCTPAVDANKRPTACWANAACRDALGHNDAFGTGIPIDFNNRFCEDFEAPSLRFNGTCSGNASRYCVGDSDPYWNCSGAGTCNVNQWVGNGPPAFGPPWDSTGTAGNRGLNGYYRKTHGLDDAGISSYSWASATPASPAYGSTCGLGVCSGVSVWAPGNPWQPRNGVSLLVIHDQDPWNTDANLSGLNASGPLCPNGSRGACDDNMVGGNRVPPGASGYMFPENFHSPSYPPNAATDASISHYGVTAILGYTGTSDDPPCLGGGPDPIRCGIWKAPWKHWELRTSNDALIKLDWLPGNVGYNAPDNWPLATSVGEFPGSWCNAGAINRVVGRFFCDLSNVLLRMGPPDATTPTADFPSGYTQGAHFPWDALHCVQKEINAIGSSSATVKVWLNGKLLQHVSNVNLSAALPYVGMFNTKYANTNDPVNGEPPTASTIYEYNDNFAIREGPPAPCPQMFTTGGGGSPTWTVDTLAPTPASCVQGDSLCTGVDLGGTYSGTATGTVACEYDCNIAGGYSGTSGSCPSSSSYSLTDVCSYAGLVPGTYTAEFRATREGVQGTRQTTFTVNAPPGSTFSGGTLGWLDDLLPPELRAARDEALAWARSH